MLLGTCKSVLLSVTHFIVFKFNPHNFAEKILKISAEKSEKKPQPKKKKKHKQTNLPCSVDPWGFINVHRANTFFTN